MDITVVQASVTKTAAFDGAAIDVSALTGDFQIDMTVTNLVGTARLGIEDQVAVAGDFSDALQGPVVSLKGPIVVSAPVTLSFQSRQFPSLRTGVANAAIRGVLFELTGTNATITYSMVLKKNL